MKLTRLRPERLVDWGTAEGTELMMSRQTLQLLRILLNPRITRTPVRVLRALREHGKRRLPTQVQDEIECGLPKRHALGFIRSWLDGEMLSRHRGQWVLDSFLPPFPGLAFNRMFENLLSGRRLSPVSAYLAVTAECRYNCWHCSLRNRTVGWLARDRWCSVIEQLHGLGASIIGFTGGEPLSRGDLPELVQAARSGGAATVVFTSGDLFDAQTAQRLHDAGLWAVCVSLDHPDPDECDRLRGAKDVQKRALDAVRLARQAGFYTMTGTVATRAVVAQGLHQRLYEMAREAGAHEFRLVEPMPCGRLDGANEDTLLTTSDLTELRRFHVDTNRRGRSPKVCAFNHVESPEAFGCGAGTQHLFIDPAGEVCPCDFTPMSFGNVSTQSLASIWLRMSAAMAGPRRHCFIQKHHKLIARHAGHSLPCRPEVSAAVCREAGTEPLPDFFALVTGQQPAVVPETKEARTCRGKRSVTSS